MHASVPKRLMDTFTTYLEVCMTREILLTNLDKDLRKKHQFVTEVEKRKSRSWRNLLTTTIDNRVKQLDTELWGQSHPELLQMLNRPDLSNRLDHYDEFPFELFMWNRFSRRVFQIPESLEMPLASAEFGNDLMLSDLHWPHESFILSFEKPFRFLDEHTVASYDTLMLSRMKHPRGFTRIMLRLFYDPPANAEMRYENLAKSNLLKQDFCSHIEKGRVLAADKTRKQFVELMYPEGRKKCPIQGSLSCTFDLGDGFDVSLNDFMQDMLTRLPDPFLGTMMRLALGWILYLEGIDNSRVSVAKRVEDRQPRNMPEGLNLITSPEEIWDIKSKHTFSGSNAAARACDTGSSGRFIRPHWRRGYKRRMPGSSPDAEKTVRIPAVLVREDLVPLYGLVGGTTSVVICK